MDRKSTISETSTPKEGEKYEAVREQVEKDLTEYQQNIRRMQYLEEYLKEDYADEDVIDSIVFARHIEEADNDEAEKDRTAFAALEYKVNAERLRRDAFMEYSTLRNNTHFLEECINLLPERERIIMKCLVLSDWTYDVTEAELRVGRSTISGAKKSAVHLLTEMYLKYQGD